MSVSMSDVEAVRDTVNNRKRSPSSDAIANSRLRSIVERIERLDEERRTVASDIRDIFTEASSAGFDKKVLRKLIAERRQDPAEVEEQDNLLDLYRREIGM